MSLERREDTRVLTTADLEIGTKEERLAAINATRKEIWAIADRAGEDANRIRYMTRPVDCYERDVEHDPWTDDDGGKSDQNT